MYYEKRNYTSSMTVKTRALSSQSFEDLLLVQSQLLKIQLSVLLLDTDDNISWYRLDLKH